MSKKQSHPLGTKDRTEISHKAGIDKWVSAKGVEKKNCMGSQHVMSFPAGSRHWDGSQEGSEWVEMKERVFQEGRRT